jgi:hypothetical protein
MQHSILKKTIMKALAFTAFFLAIFTVNANAGLDSYSIYLNNKLMLKQAVNQPLNINGLQLDKASAGDNLVIYYSQCNMPDKIGKGRSIAVKDDKGNTLKEWKFADAEGADKGMVIPVKELLVLKKRASGGNLLLVYAASQLAKEQMLTGFNSGK